MLPGSCAERTGFWPDITKRRDAHVGSRLGITLGIINLVLLVVFAVLGFRKGHWVLGPAATGHLSGAG